MSVIADRVGYQRTRRQYRGRDRPRMTVSVGGTRLSSIRYGSSIFGGQLGRYWRKRLCRRQTVWIGS